MLIREIPYPSPDDPRFFGSYLVTWRPPLFTGGLTQLRYNVTVLGFGSSPSTNTNLTSTIIYLEIEEISWIIVSVVNRTAATQQISDNSPHLRIESPTSKCAGKGNYLIF